MLILFLQYFIKYFIQGSGLLVITTLSCSPLRKKRHFQVIFFIYLIILILATCIIAYIRIDSVGGNENVFDVIFLICNYLLILSWSFIAYKSEAQVITCFLIISFPAFYIALKLSDGLLFILKNNNVITSFYADFSILFIVQLIVYSLSYFLIMRTYKKDSLMIENNSTIIMFSIFSIITIILSIIEIFLKNYGYSYLFFLSLIEVLYGIITLATSYAVIQKEESQVELAILKKLWDEDKKQYSLLKENIEIINLKCHDLKHQFYALKNNQALDEKLTKEIEESIDIYNSKIKTENEVLDIILTDYNLRSINNSIELTCMADGKLLNFMEETDLYSLFGNMLSNAFEYELKVSLDKRFISLTITQKGKYVSIHCENYYDGGELKKNDGKVISSKKDPFGHGFGMISMQRIVAKYSGEFQYIVSDNMFQIDIEIPIGEHYE